MWGICVITLYCVPCSIQQPSQFTTPGAELQYSESFEKKSGSVTAPRL